MSPTDPQARDDDPPLALPDRLRADLTRAMKARDRPTITVLRATLAALANAEAPPLADAAPTAAVGHLVDHPRLDLSETDLEGVLQAEIDDREDTIGQYTRGGRLPEAAELRQEIAVLRAYLP